jgi:pimeloyl-ACP methyl ester carboxylesterase
LFLHGVGIGLHPYFPFFSEIMKATEGLGIGLIALEIMPVSSRITHQVLDRDQMLRDIRNILKHHGWDKCILVTHSYGSAMAAQILQDPDTSAFIGPLVFVDPVAFSFHDPKLAWNFLRRVPVSASEWQLQYFASLDPGIAHALTRTLIWTEWSIWRDSVEGRLSGDGRPEPCTAFLAEKDIIINTTELGKYLTNNLQESDADENHDWKEEAWTGEKPLEVVWMSGLNHAELFDIDEYRRRLIRVLTKYSNR